MVQHVRHVEAEGERVEADRVVIRVEHPAERSTLAPTLQPRADALGIALAEEDAQGAQRALLARKIAHRREAGIDPALVGDRERPAIDAHELAHELPEKGEIGRRQLERFERRAASRDAAPQAEIRASDGSDEDLGAAVLVEEHELAAKFLGLRQGEGDEDGLSGAGGPADEGVAEVADMEGEVEWGARRRS